MTLTVQTIISVWRRFHGILMCKFMHLRDGSREQSIWHLKNIVTNLSLFLDPFELFPTIQTNRLKDHWKGKMYLCLVCFLMLYVGLRMWDILLLPLGEESEDDVAGGWRGLCLRNWRQVIQFSLETVTNQELAKAMSMNVEWLRQDLVFIWDIIYFC